MEFLYWLDQREEEPKPEDETDVLLELSKELYVEQSFLEEIVELLHDKKQVIFYGPPGTGKTYLARKLAEALTHSPTDRMLVQFHPSTSYEDFFGSSGSTPTASWAIASLKVHWRLWRDELQTQGETT